jgi:isopenicillin-N N-acyltransferase-like protein
MFPVLTISGAPYERGRQYGAQTASRVAHSIASYARLFAYRRGMDWAAAQAAALAYQDCIAAFDPDLLEEMRGIADGAGRALGEILALNARTELLAGIAPGFRHAGYEAAEAANRAAGVPDYGECTSLVALPEATRDGGTLLAQNWDWNGRQRDACVVLRIHAPGRPDVLTLTEAGMVGKIGVNEAGVGVCLNILRSTHDGEGVGVPVHVLLRGILNQNSAAGAVNLLLGAQTGASSNMLVADLTDAASVEVTPAGHGVIQPQGGVIVHTNHCVSPDTCPVAAPIDPISSTEPRYNRAEQMMDAARGAITRESIIALLRDRSDGKKSVCVYPDEALSTIDRVETVASAVMDLPARTMYIAPDIPDRAEFTPVTL